MGEVSPPSAGRRAVVMEDNLWRALDLIARLRRTSISEEVRQAAQDRAASFGLRIIDGELVGDRRLWPASAVRLADFPGEKTSQGGGISAGGDFSGGSGRFAAEEQQK